MRTARRRKKRAGNACAREGLYGNHTFAESQGASGRWPLRHSLALPQRGLVTRLDGDVGVRS